MAHNSSEKVRVIEFNNLTKVTKLRGSKGNESAVNHIPSTGWHSIPIADQAGPVDMGRTLFLASVTAHKYGRFDEARWHLSRKPKMPEVKSDNNRSVRVSVTTIDNRGRSGKLCQKTRHGPHK